MNLAAQAWRNCEDAREAIAAGEAALAFRLATRAQQLSRTETGRRLHLLAAWLDQYDRR